jgi:hypothetical protein
MRVVKLKSQREANSLKAQLIPEALTEADRTRVERELKIANPDLDLDRLTADSVVVVPDTVASLPEVTIAGEAVERLQQTSPQVLRERVAVLRAHVESSITVETEAREALRRDFRTRAVKDATDADPAIAEQIERVRNQLTEDGREARERQERLEALATVATADLEALQQRFG